MAFCSSYLPPSEILFHVTLDVDSNFLHFLDVILSKQSTVSVMWQGFGVVFSPAYLYSSNICASVEAAPLEISLHSTLIDIATLLAKPTRLLGMGLPHRFHLWWFWHHSNKNTTKSFDFTREIWMLNPTNQAPPADKTFLNNSRVSQILPFCPSFCAKFMQHGRSLYQGNTKTSYKMIAPWY